MSTFRDFTDALKTRLEQINNGSYRTQATVHIEYGNKTPEETGDFPALWIYTSESDVTERHGEQRTTLPSVYIYGYVNDDRDDLITTFETFYQDILDLIMEDDTFGDTCNFIEMSSETDIIDPYGLFLLKVIPDTNENIGS